MRIQHNIMAMNAYRNYTNNVSAMKKNLEKLSSGYRINRAGDDAAGLAISEKMRAQITGLETAQKNAKDGISLIQTAEGALTEVHDMLNRMVTLATQSANGTYDNETDRYQIQKEINQLREEIDRIADSSNFNGIKLLNGELGMNTDAFSITSTAYTDESAVTGLFGDPPTAGTTKITNTILHTDETKGRQGEFTIDLSQIVKKADGTNNATVNVTIGSLTGTAAQSANNKDLTGEDIAKALIASGGMLDGGIVVKANGTLAKGSGYTAAAGDMLYTTTDDGTGGTLTFKLTKVASGNNTWETVDSTDANLKNTQYASDTAVATKLNFDVSVTNHATGTGQLSGTENVGATELVSSVKAAPGKLANFVIDVNVAKLEDGMTLKVGDKEVTVALGKNSAVDTTAGNILDLTDMESADLSTNKVEVVDRMTKALSGNGYFTVGQNANGKMTFSETADGAGTSTVATDKQDNLTSVDKIKALFSAKKPAAMAKTDIAITPTALKEGNALTIDGKRYEFTKDTSQTAPNNVVYVDINDAANDLKAKLSANNVRATVSGNTVTVSAATKDDGAPEVLGKGLTLQIGDTADSYNQLSVVVKDTHTKALGIDNILVSDQDSAAKAIDVIKNAINYVSDVRGTLGATQNRLDHTINNLSVMTENIQDAESTIRDTDVAEEMMAYTKNNILIQSAQAMLAQANQVPQGVLQLLQ